MTELTSKIKSGSTWLGIRFVVSGLFGIITMPLIARTLSVEEYGIYNILFALITWISVLTGFGLPHVLQRFIPEAFQKEDYGLIKSLVKKGLLLRPLLSVLAIILVALFSGPVGNVLKIEGWKNYFLIFSLGIVCFIEIGLLGTVLNGLFLHKYAIISNICWSACRMTLLLLVIFLEKGLTGILLVETISWAFWLGILFLFYHKFFLFRHKDVIDSPLPYRRFLRYGGFLFFSEFGNSVLGMATDLFVITMFLGPVAAGIYGFCDRIIRLFGRILPHSILRDIIRPVFFARYSESQDPKELEKMFNFLTKLAALFLFPLAVGTCVLGREFILYGFGEKYLSAYIPLCIVISFYAANAFVEPTGYILQSLEKVNIIFYSKIFAVYNLVGDLLVVKPFGIVGVALVTSSAVLFKTLFCLYFARRYTGLDIHVVGLLKIMVNSMLMGLILYFSRSYIDGIFSFIFAVITGSVAYLAICYLNKAFSVEERSQINKLFPLKLFSF